MRTFWFSGLLALAACTGGNTDSGTVVDDTGGGTTTGSAVLTVTTASFLGAADDCDVLVDRTLAGKVGDEIVVEADLTHSVGVGGINPEGLVTHTLSPSWAGDSTWAGAEVIVPEWDTKVEEGEMIEEEVEFSLYPFHANDWWTCTNDRNESVATQIAETDGSTFYTPHGEMTLTGIDLWSDDTFTGAFISSSSAELTWVQSETSTIHFTCYASDSSGNVANPLEE